VWLSCSHARHRRYQVDLNYFLLIIFYCFCKKYYPDSSYFELLLKNVLLSTMCNMPVTTAHKGSIQNIIYMTNKYSRLMRLLLMLLVNTPDF